jgi:arylformamidase
VKAHCFIGDQLYQADLNAGIDISLSFGPGGDNPNAFGIPPAEINPIVVGDFTGSVAKGSGANCDIIRFCAHGNVTHTECMGHITPEHENVGDLIQEYFFSADLITVALKEENGNFFVAEESFSGLPEQAAAAIIVRTLPNHLDKKTKNWSGNQAPFFSVESILLLRKKGYRHLLTDLPSVDPEEDDGALMAHHIWWDYPENPRWKSSITELVYVPDSVHDGVYLVNLQFPRIQSDASPSKPVLFSLSKGA